MALPASAKRKRAGKFKNYHPDRKIMMIIGTKTKVENGETNMTMRDMCLLMTNMIRMRQKRLYKLSKKKVGKTEIIFAFSLFFEIVANFFPEI